MTSSIIGLPRKDCFWNRVVSQNFAKDLATLSVAQVLSSAQKQVSMK